MDKPNKLRISEKNIKKTIFFLILFLLVGLWFSVIVSSFDKRHIRSDATVLRSFVAGGEYGEYLEKYKGKSLALGEQKELLGKDAINLMGTYEIKNSEHAKSLGDILFTGDSGSAEWKFTLGKEGFYHILFYYVPELHGGSNIERKIEINGEVPFPEINNVVFQRVWGDFGNKIIDKNKNEVKPQQIEYPSLQKAYVKNNAGFIIEPYLFYFKEGENILKVSSEREAMSIFKIEIKVKEELKTYSEYKAKNNELGYKAVKDNTFATNDKTKNNNLKIEGEDSSLRSSSVIYAISDRSSAYNSPSDPVRIILNAIGGDNWKTPNDWIEWDVNAPEAGLYKITLRVKQATSRGMFSTRCVYINGEIPFKEAMNTKYRYYANWSMVTLGTNTEDFLFYLPKGVNKIRLEASLGDYGYQVSRVQKIIDQLNKMYQEIITRTGIKPDKYIDYKLTENIPQLIPTFKKSYDELLDITKSLDQISGERSPETATLFTVATQLNKLIKNPREIQKSLVSFSQNISSLGTFILKVSLQTLTIDYMMVTSPNYKIPRANPIYFTATWFKTRAFFKSFFFDYESIGTPELSKDRKTIEVWLLTDALVGRDQANVIRNLIDTTFKKNYNINLKIVGPEVLLTATLAGRGPDVAINAFNGTPINYALRGAIYDISVFSDFEEVKKRFTQSAMDPYYMEDFKPNFRPNGDPIYLPGTTKPKTDGYYALPNRQAWLMMFYRTDIFKEKDFKVPETWEDVISLIPELQIKNLKFYLPLNTVGATSVINPVFASYLFQNSSDTTQAFYKRTPVGDKYFLSSNIKSEEGMNAFEFWCNFYTNYSFSLSISDATFINMFRSGEMPIGIASYGTYNTLSVSAPEIKGKWKFALIPGTEKFDEDGNRYIDRKTPSMGTSVIMMKDVERRKTYDGAWEFMKWWTDTETQVAFGKEIEAILGAAARHPTPNIKAFERMPWTVKERDILIEQWKQTIGIYEVPGGYYTGRNIENAFRKVVSSNKNPREILEEYIDFIDKEIIRKRKEFGFPVPK